MKISYRMRVRWIALSAVPVLFCAAALLQRKIDVQAAPLSDANEELILQSPDAIKKLSLGYDALLGDIYWTRAAQYYGREMNEPHSDFHLLWPLLNVATTLDPKVEVAYHFGAIFLSEPEPLGAGRTDLAIQLVKKGIAANPIIWQLGTDLGFLYYWRLKDYPNAAAAYFQASRIPNSPPWIKVMAARVAQTGGSIGTSQIIWAQIYTSTKDPTIRKEAGAQLQGLKAQEDMVQLGSLASEYKKRTGHYPVSEEELRVVGLLPGIPVDPAGFPYEFDADGKAQLNPKTTFQMPKAPQVFSAPSSNTEASRSVQGRGTRVQ
ncbi:MAG TPA: hypothetical protein VJN69_05155 [Candidatus Acidoferrales bacterium]|nr:hypothetical protein [Candidatus Acidoferrales bacterium]